MGPKINKSGLLVLFLVGLIFHELVRGQFLTRMAALSLDEVSANVAATAAIVAKTGTSETEQTERTESTKKTKRTITETVDDPSVPAESTGADSGKEEAPALGFEASRSNPTQQPTSSSSTSSTTATLPDTSDKMNKKDENNNSNNSNNSTTTSNNNKGGETQTKTVITSDILQGNPDPGKILHKRLIHDTTIFWNETMRRPWLDSSLSLSSSPTTSIIHKPPMLLMTNIGWNHPNQTIGLTKTRSLRERELFTALVNHPWFHPTAWEDFETGKMQVADDQNYYVFFDDFQCRESNYPIYGGDKDDNWDFLNGRSGDSTHSRAQYCGLDEKVSNHKLFQNLSPELEANSTVDRSTRANVTFILLICGGYGLALNCANKREAAQLPMSVLLLSGMFPAVAPMDQGLIPPSTNSAKLTPQEEDDIRTCRAEQDSHRNFHHVYIGNMRQGKNSEFSEKWGGARKGYKKFHDNNRTIVFPPRGKPYPEESIVYNMSFSDILRKTRFGMAPRGDNKFSYRFTEVLSAGAILVVHADNYLFPFRPELFDWNQCAIILPEKDAGDPAMEMMNSMSVEERCRRRNYCYFEIYKKYIETDSLVLEGIVEGLELTLASRQKDKEPPEHPGVRCNETSIASLECNNLRLRRR